MSHEGPARPRKDKPEAADVSSEPVKKEKFQVVLVNADDAAEEAARDAAERHLTASKEDMKGFKGFFAKMWKHGLWREYYRQKELSRSRNEIRENEDIFAADPEVEKTAHKEAMSALVDRFAMEHPETIHKGETRTTVDRKGEEGERKLHESILTLVKDYASGVLNDANFAEARTRVLQELSASRKEANENSIYADNLLEVARQVKLAVEHGTALDDLDHALDIKLGTAKNSIRTQANYNAADRIIEKLKTTPVGRFIAPGTLALGVGIASSLASYAGRRVITSTVAKAVTFGGSMLAAGAVTGFAENKRIKEDRRQHAREMAQGRTYEKGKSPRREEMDKYIYEMSDAETLTRGIREKFEGKESAADFSEAERNEFIANLADIEARIELSEGKSIDLIAYSGPGKVERERTNLDLARWQAKAELAKLFKKSPDPSGKSFEDLLKIATEARVNGLTQGDEGIEARNKRFDKMKIKRVAAAAAAGAIGGAVIGGLVQEGTAFFDNSQVGAIEHLVKGHHVYHESASTHTTPTEWLRNLIEGKLPAGAAANHVMNIGEHAHIRMPEGMQLVQSDHGYCLVEDGQTMLDGLHVGADGSFDHESLDQLVHHGFLTSATTAEVVHHATGSVSPQDFVAQHPGLTTQVHRDLWFDNDTPAPLFDKNELRVWWGGNHNLGVDEHGNYTFTMQHMTPNGSYHNGLSVNAMQLAREGRMHLLLSVSQDTQMHPIDVPIGPDGVVHIDPNSEAGRMLFHTDARGHAVFLGRFAEVAEVTSREANGSEHVRVLATHVGHGLSEIPGNVDTTVPETTTTITHPSSYHIDPPPVFPLWGRAPLEPTRAIDPNGVPPLVEGPVGMGYGYYYGHGSVESTQAELEKASAEPDPYHLKPGTKREWLDKDGKPVERNIKRERERIQKYLEQQDLAYKTELDTYASLVGPMSEKCRVAVIIPARFEEKNLANLLDQYVLQVGPDNRLLDPETFELNILVNRKEGEAPDASMAVIEEWKKKHPGYRINAVDVVFPPEKANVGTARKYITDLVLKRSLDRAQSDGPLYIESEDADLVSIDRRTVHRLVERFDERPYLDVLRGVQDRQPEILQKNDLLFFERRFHDMMEVFMRREAYRPENLKGSSFVWNRVISGGWNTAFTAESYAQIGGYVPDLMGEDMKIGQKISVLRGGTNAAGEFVPNTKTAEASGLRANSSPRRYLDAMNKGQNAYDDFDNQDLKHKTIEELLDGVKEFAHAKAAHKRAYEKAINGGHTFLYENLRADVAAEVFERTLRNMGLRPKTDFTYRADGTAELTDKAIPRVQELMKKYKDEQRHMLGYQRQNSKLKKPKIRVTADSKPTEEPEKKTKPKIRITAPTKPGEKPKIRVTAPTNEAELRAQEDLARRIQNGA